MEALELVGGLEKRELSLTPWSKQWALEFEKHRAAIERATNAAFHIDHVGSTSVPGLSAKAIVDILVLVPDITDESSYIRSLVRAGYVLRVREPGHRMMRTKDLDVHIHFYENGSIEGSDILRFRDALRSSEYECLFYQKTKEDLIVQVWPDMNSYADAKSEVIGGILSRARTGLDTHN